MQTDTRIAVAATARVNSFRAQLRSLLLGCLMLALLIPGTEIHCSPLRDKQAKFSTYVAMLILQAGEMGYEVTLGEAWRSSEQAAFKTKINAEKGIGIAASLHTQRLAIDINLFRDGKFLTQPADYARLGSWWEKQCAECRWGGRFKTADAVHFSFAHNGIQ